MGHRERCLGISPWGALIPYFWRCDILTFSYKTAAENFSLDSLCKRYDVSKYAEHSGKISFCLTSPKKIDQLQEEIKNPPRIKSNNDIAVKTINDIIRATKAELLLLQSGFDIAIEKDEIEVSSSLKSEEDADVIAEYFKIYVVDILNLYGGIRFD